MQVRVQGASHKCEREGKLRYRYWASIHSWAIGSGWVPAYRGTKVRTPSRRTACLGVWGRGEGEGGVRVKREKEKNGRGWSSESRGVKPMSGRGQRWTSRHPTQQDKERLRYPARTCSSGVAKKMMSTLHQVVVVVGSEVGRP